MRFRFMFILMLITLLPLGGVNAQGDAETISIGALTLTVPESWQVADGPDFVVRVIENETGVADSFFSSSTLPDNGEFIAITSGQLYAETFSLSEDALASATMFTEVVGDAFGATESPTETTINDFPVASTSVQNGDLAQVFYTVQLDQELVLFIGIGRDIESMTNTIESLFESGETVGVSADGSLVLTDKLAIYDNQLTIAHPLTWVAFTSETQIELGNNGDAFDSTGFGDDNVRVTFNAEPNIFYLNDLENPTLDSLMDAYVADHADEIVGEPEAMTIGGHPALFIKRDSGRNTRDAYFVDLGDAGFSSIEVRYRTEATQDFQNLVMPIINSLNNEEILAGAEFIELPEPTFAVEADTQLTFTPDNTEIDFAETFGQDDMYDLVFELDDPEHFVTIRFTTYEPGEYDLSTANPIKVAYEITVDPDEWIWAVYDSNPTGTLLLENDLRTLTGEFSYTVEFTGFLSLEGFIEFEPAMPIPETVTVTGTFNNIPIAR